MKISEVIEKLEAAQDEYGDLELYYETKVNLVKVSNVVYEDEVSNVPEDEIVVLY